MEVLFTTSLAYLVAIVTAYGVYKAAQRVRRRPKPPAFKPTPWDEFRSRVVQGTGCQTVHEALRQGLVCQLPGGWLEFDGLKHHKDEAATLEDYWQAVADMPVVEPLDALNELPGFALGDWVLWNSPHGGHRAMQIGHDIGFNSVAARDPQTTLLRKAGEFKAGDVVETPRNTSIQVARVDSGGGVWFEGGSCEGPEWCTLVTPAELRNPWVGRHERRGRVVWVDSDLVLSDGSRVPVDGAELHWDDVRDEDTRYGLGSYRPASYRPAPASA